MKNRIRGSLISLGLGLLLALCANGALRAQARPEFELKAAMDKEVVEGDLKTAIEMYRKLSASADRAVRAKALLRMGQCYEKLGNSEARRAYQSILRDLPDQKDVAEQARLRLAALGARPAASSGKPSSGMIWTAPADATLEKVSPDGRHVALTRWNRSGTSANIILHDLKSDIDRRVTNSVEETGETAESCVFSKDGSHLAYAWYSRTSKGAELRVVTLAGNDVPQPRRLIADRDDVKYVWPRDWSPDGKWIAASISRKDLTGQLAIVGVSDGTVRVLKTSVPEGLNDMAFSPDGKYLAIDRFAGPSRTRDIVLLALDTGREIPVVVHAADDALVGWSPDGTLIFVSDRSGENDLWAQRIVDGTAQGAPRPLKPDVGRFRCLGVSTSGALYSLVDNNRVGSEVRMGTFDFTNGAWISPSIDAHDYFRGSNLTPAVNPSPDWSPDGKSFAYVVGRGPQYSMNPNPVIIVRSLDSDEVRQVRPKIDDLMGPMMWTPDGTAFIGSGRNSEGHWGVWRIDARTGVTSLVAPTGGLTYVFGWSPDGKKLRYFGHTKGVMERDMVSGEETKLADGGIYSFAGVSPDGGKVYFRQELPPGATPPATETALIERDRASGQERVLARRTFLPWPPTLSPDGRFMVAAVNDPATSSTAVVVVPTDGSQTRELMRVERKSPQAEDSTQKMPPLFPVSWAPDSQSVFVNKHAGERGGPELWWVPLDGREPKRIDVGAVGDVFWAVRAHPDGRRVAFSVRRVEPFKPYEVWVLENLLPKASSAAKAR